MVETPGGHDSRLCGAQKRQGDGTCGRPAGWGTDHAGEGHCKLHGGSTRTVSKGAHLRIVQAEAREAIRGVVIEDVTDPLRALARHAGEIVAVRNYLRGEVERLESLRYQAASGEQLRAELAAYQAALRDTTQVLTAYARLNIDARLAAITDAQAKTVMRAIEAVISLLAPDAEQANRARAAAARHLRAVP